MANILAAQNGNFNATATWTGGVVPGVGDVAYANNKAVTITADVTCDKLSTRGDNGATAGGGFTVAAGSTGLTVTAAIEAGTTTCLTSNLTTGQTLTVDASVGGVLGGSASNAHGASNANTGTLTITGNCTGGNGSPAHGANNNTSGTLTITGNCTGGSTGNAIGALNNSTGTLTITGIAYASALNGGVINNSAGVLRVVRAVGNGFGLGATGVSNVAAVASITTGSLTYVQEIEFGSLGNTPVSGPILLTDVTSNVASFYKEGGGRKTLVDTNATAGVLPSTSDVRSGVVYSTGNLTGTLAVPAAGSVALGVAVDNTTGTAVLTEANVRAAIGLASANLDAQLDALPTAAENAAAVWAAATRTVTGGTVDTLTNAPDVPTEAEIAAEVWGATTREITGGTVDTLTNSPDVPTEAEIASAVRTELGPELARVANAATTQEVADIVEGALTAT